MTDALLALLLLSLMLSVLFVLHSLILRTVQKAKFTAYASQLGTEVLGDTRLSGSFQKKFEGRLFDIEVMDDRTEFSDRNWQRVERVANIHWKSHGKSEILTMRLTILEPVS